MKLHTADGSPVGRKVEVVIAHLGLQVERVYHDGFAGGLRTPEYLSINPNGKVPVLVDGSFTLSESNAIMQYLADKEAAEDLFPRDARLRADIVRWQFWEGIHFNEAASAIAFETVVKPKHAMEVDTALVARATGELKRFAAVLDQYLQGRRYLVADRLTLADYSVATFEGYRGRMAFDWSPYRNINVYFDRIKLLEPWVRTTPQPARAA